ncbi:hypothetical protein GCM10010464_04290 [Pseudonocardia yunnanensis]
MVKADARPAFKDYDIMPIQYLLGAMSILRFDKEAPHRPNIFRAQVVMFDQASDILCHTDVLHDTGNEPGVIRDVLFSANHGMPKQF